MGKFFNKIFNGMKKTKLSFMEKCKYLFTKNELSEDFFDELEYILLSSDIGNETTQRILAEIRLKAKQNRIKIAEDCKLLLKQVMIDLLEENECKDYSYPLVIMVVGVNGVGKTTTIGKLAKEFSNKKKKVIIAAADTFRAAANDQLAEWAKRANVQLVNSSAGSDAGAVVFDALSSAKAKNADVVIIDTAGRLHNKIGLMNELVKISKVVTREMPQADYHKFIVIDATTGQNAIEQVKLFDEAINLTDVVITKLDGTAKGGVIFPIADNFSLPIRNIGVGESIDDLIPFDAKDFVESIFE